MLHLFNWLLGQNCEVKDLSDVTLMWSRWWVTTNTRNTEQFYTLFLTGNFEKSRIPVLVCCLQPVTCSPVCFLLLCSPSSLSGAAHQVISPAPYQKEGGGEEALCFHRPNSPVLRLSLCLSSVSVCFLLRMEVYCPVFTSLFVTLVDVIFS